MKPKIQHRRLCPEKSPELAHLATLVGEFIEYWGFKSVQGRLWFYLYASEEPLSSIELSEVLGVSAALVTQSVQVLLEYRVIESAGKGPNGVLRYRANANVAESIRNVLISREVELLKRISMQVVLAANENKKVNGSHLKLNEKSLEKISQWIELFQMFLKIGIATMNKEKNMFTHPSLFLKGLRALIKQSTRDGAKESLF